MTGSLMINGERSPPRTVRMGTIRSMREGATRIILSCVCLFAIGAIVNWSIAIRFANIQTDVGTTTDLDPSAVGMILDSRDINPAERNVAFAVGLSHLGFDRYAIELDAVDGAHLTFIRDESGWPRRAFTSTSVVEWDPMNMQWRESRSAEWNVFTERGARWFGITRVPYGILPVGFLANSMVYGALVGGLASGFMRWRRRLRLDQGHCPRCRYDLQGLSGDSSITCPECGTHIRRTALDRPAQPLRLWMLPMIAPAVGLTVMMFFGHISWMWARLYVFETVRPFSFRNALLVFGTSLWLAAMLWLSYGDRRRGQRASLTLSLATVLTMLFVIPTWLLAGWYSSG